MAISKQKPPLKLKRPLRIPVMVTEAEMSDLQTAADEFGVALSVFLRIKALEAARRRENGKAA